MIGKLKTQTQNEKVFFALSVAAIIGVVLAMILNPAFAYEAEIQGLLDQILDIVGTIFRAIGIILAVWGVGQLILAFKDENASAKSSASMLMVVGIVLFVMPTIIGTLSIDL